MEEDDLEMEPMEEKNPEEGFGEGGEQIIGEEDLEEDLEEDPKEDPEVYFKEEFEDPRAESGVPEILGGEHKDRVTA